MTQTPAFSIGTISQRAWRGVGPGPLDDCWACADAQCIHGCAPHLGLSGVPAYRKAAGVPDTATGAEGGSLEASLRAIKALYPTLAPMVKLYRGTFAGFDAALLAGSCISASVYSASLATKNGVPVRHRIALRAKDGVRQYLNPLDAAYSFPEDVSQATLRKWLADYPEPAEAAGLIFPTVDQAFTTHPLYVKPTPPVATKLGPGLYEVEG